MNFSHVQNSVPRSTLPTKHGQFDIQVFTDASGLEHVALSVGLDHSSAPLVRIHSECLTGDAFGSLRCDCGPQLDAAMSQIQAEGSGAILYLRQEGRGIGLANKIRAYALQDQGHDTLEANLLLGLPADARDYEICRSIFKALGLTTIRLITNNSAKISAVAELGVTVTERVPIHVGENPLNTEYLATKRNKMGHLK